MNYRVIPVILFLSLYGAGHAQQVNPSVISSAGETAVAGGISLEWTLGETVVESMTAGERWYTQGFHQPFLYTRELPAGADWTSGYQVSLAPNPVQSLLTVNITAPERQEISFQLTDISGRRLSLQRKGTGSAVHRFDLSDLVPGMYLLEIRNNRGLLLRSYKIIKSR